MRRAACVGGILCLGLAAVGVHKYQSVTTAHAEAATTTVPRTVNATVTSVNETRHALARSVAPALAVDVHIFTSTIADERRYRTVHGERRFWTSADFDVFRRRGVSVHIDVEGRGGPAKHPALTTDAALLHMAHWSTADIFLAGHSSFSSIPALLNPNCVMAPMYTPNSAKRACVARLARARAAELSRA